MIINVDDLGLSDAVNKAVVTLAEQKRIQSASFMSLGSVSSSDTTILHRNGIDIGLHLDFTELVREQHDFGNLKQLIASAWLRRLSTIKIKTVINHQLDLFEEKIGATPVFIDGHQHVHQFPRIREYLMELVIQRYGATVAMRSTLPMQRELKSQIIYQLGGPTFRQLCQKNHIKHNQYFAGVYQFNNKNTCLKNLWSQWISAGKQKPDSLVMCHPAIADNQWYDVIRKDRELEFNWLSGEMFGNLLKDKQVKTHGWNDIPLNH